MKRAAAEPLLALLFPRRCPFCGAVLGQDAVAAAFCPACAAEERRLLHKPPRLPETEHDFYALSGAAGAYYYADAVRRAILLCKRGNHPWYSRELADLMAVRIWHAEPAPQPGRRPTLDNASGIPLYSCIVPVPPREPAKGTPGLPLLLARRLGQVLDIPVQQVLHPTRALRPQKQLNREERLQNTRDAYAALPGTDLTGRRVLLVDDIITTGATVSACALALAQAGAADVFAVCIAADEELPKEKQHAQEHKQPSPKE